VAHNFLRGLRNSAALNTKEAVDYFRMQARAISGLFDCAGLKAAHALSSEFTKQWGPRMLPELEPAMFLVLQEAMLSCITAEKQRLPLLDVFWQWIKSEEFLRANGQEISDRLVKRCEDMGVDSTTNASVCKALARLGRVAPSADDQEMAPAGEPLAVQQSDNMPPPPVPTRRITSKRKLEPESGELQSGPACDGNGSMANGSSAGKRQRQMEAELC
jgi:hypothetical protein